MKNKLNSDYQEILRYEYDETMQYLEQSYYHFYKAALTQEKNVKYVCEVSAHPVIGRCSKQNLCLGPQEVGGEGSPVLYPKTYKMSWIKNLSASKVFKTSV